ncbi:MAG: pyridoxamine 5'-phosphate oxidase family protein [Chloroflexota bacterium]
MRSRPPPAGLTSREPPPTTGRVVLVFAGGDAAPSPDHAPEMPGEVPSARSDPGEGGVEPFAVRQGRRATRAQRRPSGADEPFDDSLAEPFPRQRLPPPWGDRFAARAGFDPRALARSYRRFRISPRRIQTSREVSDLPDRELTRVGLCPA